MDYTYGILDNKKYVKKKSDTLEFVSDNSDDYGNKGIKNKSE
jgi:hypothetical protein